MVPVSVLPLRSTPERVEVFDGVAAVACGDILLLLWRTPARVERIRRAVAWTDALIAATPGTISICQFLLSSASPPDREARVLAKPEALRLAPRIRRAVMVPLGDSIWQNVVRAILRLAVLVAGHASKLKVVSSEREALDALLQVSSPHSADRRQLEAAVAALYAALELQHSVPGG